MDSNFTYDPTRAKVWSETIVEYMNGGEESFKACSLKFNEQLSKLVQPDVWCGAGAKANYQAFRNAANAFVNFMNQFGNSYAEAMNSFTKSVNDLEVATLGTDTTVLSKFGNLSFNQLEELADVNVVEDKVRYNFVVIGTIYEDLTSILKTLQNVQTSMESTLNQIGSGSEIWSGQRAEDMKKTLKNILSENMEVIKNNINQCITNINEAMASAKTVSGGGSVPGTATEPGYHQNLDGKSSVYVTPEAAAREQAKTDAAVAQWQASQQAGPGATSTPVQAASSPSEGSPVITAGSSQSGVGPGVSPTPVQAAPSPSEGSPVITAGSSQGGVGPGVSATPVQAAPSPGVSATPVQAAPSPGAGASSVVTAGSSRSDSGSGAIDINW